MSSVKIPLKEKSTMEEINIKKISVSAKRQMTIPKEFYDELQLDSEVTCQIVDGALIIKPVPKPLDFSEFILSDLVKEGYEGVELVKEFTYRKTQMNDALHKMVEEAKDYDYKSYETAADYFNSLDDEDDDE
jgi:antitoxin component of MazEF toxin-antitoxin module